MPNSFRESYSQLRLFIIFVLGVLCWTYLYPALNWPDEIYKVSQVGIDRNIYLDALSRLSTSYCVVSYVNAENMAYLSNVFHVRMIGGFSCYYDMKFASALILIAVTLIGFFALRRRDLRILYLMSLIWPANLFYMTSINQQTLFCTLSILLMVFVLGSKRVWPYAIIAIALVALDRSFVALVIYLGALMAIRWRPSLALTSMIVLLIGAILARPYIEGTDLFVGGGETIGDISQGLSNYYDSPVVSLALLAISFVYLGGTNTIIGVGIDYLTVFIALGLWTWQAWSNVELRAYLYSFVFAYFLVVSFIPTIETFRYYVFLVPVLLYFLVVSGDRQRKYVRYSVVMSVVYLIQAAIIYA